MLNHRPITLRWTSVAVVLLATVAVGLALFQAHAGAADSRSGEAGRRLPVATVAPQAVESFTLSTRYSGLVQSRRAATLAFQPEGRVAELSVDEGDRVEQGQALASLDRRRLEASLREIEGEIESTEAALALARQNEHRQKNLRAENAVSERALDQAVAERRREQGQLNRLKGQRDRLQADLDDAVLKAPFDGVVVEKMIERGDMVSAGTPAFRLIQPHRLEARIGLPARERGRYQKGDEVSLMVGGEDVTGEVLEQLPEIDAGRRTLTLRIALEANEGHYFAGQLAHLNHDARIEESGYQLPETALTGGRAGLWSVLVADPNGDHHRVQRISVEWLYGDGKNVLVRGPLSEQMHVIAEGPHRVVPGQRVTLMDETGDAE